MPLKVAIGVHGRFHAFDLATALRGRAEVVQLATTYPAWAARRFVSPEIPIKSLSWLEYWRRLYAKTRIGPNPDASISVKFGKFAARTMPADADVFVGWSSASLEALETAKSRGILGVVERGSTHILHQQAVLQRVYGANDAHFGGIDPGIIDRELAEYELADLIAVPTAFVASTFREHGIPDARILVNPYGVDADRFECPPRPRRDRPTILFVGSVGFQKGAPDLIAAFDRLDSDAALEFAGPVERGWRPRLPPGASFLGPLDRDGVVAALARADIFCLPSHQEGLSLALLQGMAAGLPVVTTPESGAGDIVTDGREGRIVTAGDREGLAQALADLIDAPDARTAMGESARLRATQLNWEAYGKRAVQGYGRARKPGVESNAPPNRQPPGHG